MHAVTLFRCAKHYSPLIPTGTPVLTPLLHVEPPLPAQTPACVVARTHSATTVDAFLQRGSLDRAMAHPRA